MRNSKISITPFLELGIKCAVVSITGLLQLTVEMDSIVFIEVVGGQIRPTAKPPLGPFCRLHFKVSVVEVNRWHIWIPRMDHRTDSKGIEWE